MTCLQLHLTNVVQIVSKISHCYDARVLSNNSEDTKENQHSEITMESKCLHKAHAYETT